MSLPKTLGDFREKTKDLPDDTQMFVSGKAGTGADLAVDTVFVGQAIPWSHDCTDNPHEGECPTVTSVEIDAVEFGDLGD